MSYSVDAFLSDLAAKNPHEPEFHQAVREVVESVVPALEARPAYVEAKILERMVEPERVLQFRVPWVDDEGEVHVNRGYRVEMSSTLGPYKGGLRFRPSVRLGVLKFLAFEQVLKNALTTLPLGGGKGGADFDPKGKSDGEVMRFCQAFMSELYRHLGDRTDVPAGDIGVGGREVGFLFGQYKKLSNRSSGALTGKGVQWGGSRMRTEATGYGLVYFVRHMLEQRGERLDGKTVAISGAGNVALHAAQKAIQLGAKVVTMSDSGGSIHDPEGIGADKLEWIMGLKNERRGRIEEYARQYDGAEFREGRRPWDVPVDVALPCAIENEISAEEAKTLVDNGVAVVAEGANMPTEAEAIEVLRERQILFAPGKAANAGGVATSGLEMAQNAYHTRWSRERVDERLQEIMQQIHAQCVAHGERDGWVDYVAGANVAGFCRVADAMLDQGVV